MIDINEFLKEHYGNRVDEANLLPNSPKGKDKKVIDDLVKAIVKKYKYKDFRVEYKEGQIYGGTGGEGFNNKGYDYEEIIDKLNKILKYGSPIFESELYESNS